MPDSLEGVLRAAIEAGVRAALAELDTRQEVKPEVDDTWPDWDEFGGLTEPPAADAAPVPSLRDRLVLGQVDGPILDDEPDTGEVFQAIAAQPIIPISNDTFSSRGSGFDPLNHPDGERWIKNQYAKDVLLPQRAVPLEDRIKAV